MRLTYKLAILLLAFALVGCDRINAMSMSSAEKINLALPIAPELTTAQSILYAALETNKYDKRRAVEQFEQLLTVRALTCAGTTRIGRFDLPPDIKSKLSDLDCFKKQDGLLAEWIGLQRVALALRLPALRPYAELKGKNVIPSAENSVTMATAAGANIAVVKNGSGKFTVIDLSGGKPISSFQAPGEAHRFASISPNGRMLAVPISNRSLTVFDLENGVVLWNTDKYSDLVAWIPGIEAIVLNETGASKAALMDLRTGRFEPYLSAERNLTWAVTMPGATSQFLIGSQNSASLMEHVRSADGSISSSTTKQWRLSGSGASSLTPMLMLNGKLLAFVSHRDLGWLNLENGDQGVWAMSAMRAHGFTKLDESNIIFTDSKRNSHTPTRKLLDVERLTVSTVQDISATEGYALPFAPRAGYAKSLNSAVVIQSSALADNPQPLTQLIAEAQLEEQLAKLQIQPEASTQPSFTKYEPAEIAAAQAVAAAAAAVVAASEAKPRSERQDYIDLLSKQVRAANVVSAMHDGLPREVIERIRNGTQQNSVSASGAQALTARAPIKPLLIDMPGNAQVAILGVYQGARSTSAAPSAGSSRPNGEVRVTVGSGSSPLILVLSSYEPVRWNVRNMNGRKIAAVLLSGYHESTVVGLTNTKVLQIGSSYAYKLASPEYERLKTEVTRYVSNPVASFQGRYEGQEFAITQ
jgi:hypothetical protein